MMMRLWTGMAVVGFAIVNAFPLVSASDIQSIKHLRQPQLIRKRASRPPPIISVKEPAAPPQTSIMDLLSLPHMTTMEEEDFYHSHVQFAADAYCSRLKVGDHVGTDGIVLWVTGNGDNIQVVYVAYSPTLGIIIGHQGTNKSSLASIFNDLKIDLVKPIKGLQWLGPHVKMSEGFQEAWGDTAEQVLTQVRLARLQHPDARVSTTGHSLGAATALLGALHLKQALGIDVGSIVFGLPRTGNNAVSPNSSFFKTRGVKLLADNPTSYLSLQMQ